MSVNATVQPDPARDPAVRVALHAPAGFRADRPWALVLHLHGSGECGARAAFCGPMPAWSCPRRADEAAGACLAERLDAAGFNYVFAAPQLHLGARSGYPSPPWGDRDYAMRLVGSIAARVPRCGAGSPPVARAPTMLALSAHSLGGRALEALLENTDWRRWASRSGGCSIDRTVRCAGPRDARRPRPSRRPSSVDRRASR